VCFAYIINHIVPEFIRATIINLDENNEVNLDTGNGSDFTIDISDTDLDFREIISKLRAIAN